MVNQFHNIFGNINFIHGKTMIMTVTIFIAKEYKLKYYVVIDDLFNQMNKK
jgi:hypothetical protein